MMQKINNTIELMESWDLKTLKSIKSLFFFLIVVDLFGIYWYLGWKTLSIAILLVIVACLSGILALETRRKAEKEVIKLMGEDKEEDKEEKEDKDEKKKKDDDDEEPDIIGGMGLPDPDEYNKRLEKSIGL